MTAGSLDDLVPAILQRASLAADRAVHGGDPVNTMARTLLVRSVANAVAGGRDQLVQAMAARAGHGNSSLLVGASPVAGPAAAAAVHAAAITVSQCDDGLREAAGHPGLHAFAAAWSVTEQQDGDLNALLRAFVKGWEVGAHLGLILGRPRIGVHPHGGWGAAAAAVAAAAAAGQGAPGQEAALRSSLSVALAGPDSTVGSGRSAHYLLPALGTANGVQVALLEISLSDSPANALSHFASVAHGQSAGDLSVWGNEPFMLSSYVKPIGLCAHTLTAWSVCDALRSDGTVPELTGVEVTTYRAAASLDGTDGPTELARRFSVPWAVAFGLSGRTPSADDSDLAPLAAMVKVRHDPALDELYPGRRPSQVRLFEGSTVVAEATADVHPGDRESPLSAAAEQRVVAELMSDLFPLHDLSALLEINTVPGSTPLRSITAGLANASNRSESFGGVTR